MLDNMLKNKNKNLGAKRKRDNEWKNEQVNRTIIITKISHDRTGARSMKNLNFAKIIIDENKKQKTEK